MARIGRWKGAIVVEHGGACWLVGNPKEPCAEMPETLAAPWIKRLDFAPPLTGELGCDDGAGGGEPIAQRLAERLLIQRNGSVSERLWRLVAPDGARHAQWLLDTPTTVWDIVRDTVLRCT